MLTTKDNPYNPFEQYDLWLQYDLEMGYQSCERLGKVIQLEEGMTDPEKEEAMDRAIDEIIKYDPLGIYVRATENSTYPIGN
jgi:hypothetical protein